MNSVKIEHNDGTIALYSGFDKNKINVKVGDVVLYGKYSGTELRLEGKDYLIMSEKDILAII